MILLFQEQTPETFFILTVLPDRFAEDPNADLEEFLQDASAELGVPVLYAAVGRGSIDIAFIGCMVPDGGNSENHAILCRIVSINDEICETKLSFVISVNILG